jgi:hypothetical protein
MPCSPHTTFYNLVPIWLPHWPACMCRISREEAAWRRGARGRKKAGRSGETQETLCGSLARETGNSGGARAFIPNGSFKWFYHSDLSSFGTVQSTLGVFVYGHEIFASATCQLQFAKASAATLPRRRTTRQMDRGKEYIYPALSAQWQVSPCSDELRRARVDGCGFACRGGYGA